MLWPFVISLTSHLLIFGFVMFKDHIFKPKPYFDPAMMSVQMVNLSDVPAAAPAPKAQAKEAAQVVEKAAPAEVTPPPKATPKETAPQPEVSIAETPPKAKSALKYKTFKSEKVLEKAMEQLEKKVENTPPKPLEDTFKKLQEKVAKAEKSQQGEEKGTAAEGNGKAPEGTGIAAVGPSTGGGKGEIEKIDLYRLEVAYQIKKNFAYVEQLAGAKKSLMALVVIKIMPDGKITDIFFTQRSGNAYLDDTAYKTIMKSNPTKPFPEGLRFPYIEMGLRFTPEGLQ